MNKEQESELFGVIETEGEEVITNFVNQLMETSRQEGVREGKGEIVKALREEYGGDFMNEGIRVGKVLHKMGILNNTENNEK